MSPVTELRHFRAADTETARKLKQIEIEAGTLDAEHSNSLRRVFH
jgi:hypothetical protein